MPPEHLIARLLADYQRIWLDHFPARFRRAEWHIIHHLATRGRAGTSLGEVYGLMRQIFLLDDATVRDRVVSLAEAGLCRVDGPESPLSARTILAPTPVLLDTFDRHLTAFGEAILATAARLDPAAAPAVPPTPAAIRREALRFLRQHDEHWRAGLDGFFDSAGLSPSRRLEARRQLISTSHATLIRLALEHHYAAGAAGEGMLADRMAAHLLELTSQNFQTTRDHVTYLLGLGLLERRAGKALHVALAASAALHLGHALRLTADLLPGLARSMADLPGDPRATPVLAASPEETVNIRPARVAAPSADQDTHQLVVIAPPEARRRLTIGTAPLSIGRAPPCELILADASISRLHCRIQRVGEAVAVTDLGSMNGTFVDGARIAGTVELSPGARLQLGTYALEYQHLKPASRAFAEATRTDAEPPEARTRRSRTKQESR